MNKTRRISILIAAAGAALLGPSGIAQLRPAPPRADGAVWTSIGPDGGHVLDLAVNPANPNDLMAVLLSTPSQIDRTTNGGKSWKRIGLLNDTITDIAYGPPGSGRFYAMSFLSLFESRNGGSTWTQLMIPAGFNSLDRLAVHPATPDRLFILGRTAGATESLGIARSSDDGRTWTSKRITPGADLTEGDSLCIHPANPDVLYFSGVYRTATSVRFVIYRTTDGGSTWRDCTGPISTQVYSLATDPGNPARLYAATTQGVYRTSDSGQTWQSGPYSSQGYAVAVDPSNPSVLYSGYQKSVVKSVDGGLNWSSTGTGLAGDCQRLAVAGGKVFYGSLVGVYVSADGGANWATGQAGIRAVWAPSFCVAPSSPNVLYANVPDLGFLNSENFGRSWILLPYFYSCDDQGRIVAVDPADPKRLYMLAPGEG